MQTEMLFTTEAPYLHVAESTLSEITNLGWSLSTPSVVVRFLRGKKMTSVAHLFDEFAAAFQFPYYFGENWDAFDECITDLSWIPANVYILIITNSEATLSGNDEQWFNPLTDILQNAGKEWSRPVEEPKPRSRPPLPFHVIFQSSEPGLGVITSRLRATGIPFQELQMHESAAFD